MVQSPASSYGLEKEMPLHGGRPNDPALRKEDQEDHEVKSYNALSGTVMIINSIVGTGCFALPAAFYHGGLFMTSILLFMGLLFAMLSANYILEITARLTTIFDIKEAHGNTETISVITKKERESNALIASVRTTEPVKEDTQMYLKVYPYHRLTYRQLDYLGLSTALCAKTMRKAIEICLFSYIVYGWAYSTVFASSTSSYLFKFWYPSSSYNCGIEESNKGAVYDLNDRPKCDLLYQLSLLFYGVFVLYLTVRDFTDQLVIQKLLTAYRLMVFLLMFSTMLYTLMDPSHIIHWSDMPKFNLAKFGVSFGSSFLALDYHFCIPELVQPLRHKAKAHVVLAFASILSVSFYFLLGILGAVTFEDKVNDLITLNWNDYTGCGYGWDKCNLSSSSAIPWYGQLIRSLILLFPAINMASAYSLFAIPLADNLKSSLPDYLRLLVSPNMLHYTVRTLTVILPVFCAFFVKELGIVYTVVGIIAFVISLLIPFYLQRESILLCLSYWPTIFPARLSFETPYSFGFLSTKPIADACVVFSILLIIVAIRFSF